MDGNNPQQEYFLCVALLGGRHRAILQLTDSATANEPARLYVHSQVNDQETIQMLANLLAHLSAVLANQPDYFNRVRLPEDTGAIFRHL